jgi:hypothetical protein
MNHISIAGYLFKMAVCHIHPELSILTESYRFIGQAEQAFRRVLRPHFH